MKGKIIITILILLIFIFDIQVINAVPAAPSPYCVIIAKVIKVEKIDNYYKLNLDILWISTVKQEGSKVVCDNSYIENAERSRPIILSEYNKNPISEGQKIIAIIHFGGDEHLGGYFVYNIKILKDWYYILPTIIILLLIILYTFFKRKIFWKLMLKAKGKVKN